MCASGTKPSLYVKLSKCRFDYNKVIFFGFNIFLKHYYRPSSGPNYLKMTGTREFQGNQTFLRSPNLIGIDAFAQVLLASRWVCILY